MHVTWQAKRFKVEDVLSTYGRLCSNDDVKLYDVNRRHKTIRERAAMSKDLSDAEQVKLRLGSLGELVLISGKTMQERQATP